MTIFSNVITCNRYPFYHNMPSQSYFYEYITVAQLM